MSAAIGRSIKRKVAPSKGEHIPRFFHNLWSYRVSQLTTGNIKSMRDAAIDSSGATPVHSDLQPHGLFQFRGDESPSICIAIPKSSKHSTNLPDCEKVSVMSGHTDPQIFFWFKQLGTVPPRSIVTGKAEIITGDMKEDVWERMFVRHPVIHGMAEKMWVESESKSPEEADTIRRREKEEDEARMVRMAGADWRHKFQSRERNPTKEEEEERPIYIMKPDTFTVFRVKPEVMLYGDYAGQMLRVWETEAFPPMDPLARFSPRFLRIINTSREKLVSSVNINYNLKLTNLFVYGVDKFGLWAMGTQERFDASMGSNPNAPRENWSEYRLEFGKDQAIETEAELEFWVKGLMRLGTPETGARNDASLDNADPADMQFRN